MIAASAIGAIVVVVLVIALAKRGGGSDKDGPTRGSNVQSLVIVDAPPALKLVDAARPATTPADASDVDEVPDKPESSKESGLPVTGDGPCKVEVTSEPAGSTIALDGTAMGPSPMIIATDCKAHHIAVAHPRYAPAARDVTLAADTKETVHFAMKRPTHQLTVATVPTGATVYIEGRRAGTSPTSIQIMGYYGMSVTVEKPGWKRASQTVYSTVNPDKVTIWLTRDLPPVP